MSLTLLAIISLGSIGTVAAVILFAAAKKFYVEEDPRIDQVEEVLPAANCGGCGFPGCRGFAEALVKANDLADYNCPVGGADVMQQVASILGKEATIGDPMVAVVRCNGTCENRPSLNQYDGAASCTIASSLYGGETGCSYGCLGLGECVDACDFNAMYMDKETGLPVIIEDNCVSCGACVKACPKDIIELRKVGPKSRRIFVSCINEDKGGVARKACKTACIGCSKCFKECPFDAIEMKNNLAYIDYNKCKLCRKCVVVCPTNAIHELNFPPKKVKPAVKVDAGSVAVDKKVVKAAAVKESPEKDKAVKDSVVVEDTSKKEAKIGDVKQDESSTASVTNITKESANAKAKADKTNDTNKEA